MRIRHRCVRSRAITSFFSTGPNEGKPVHVDDLELGGPQVQAYPADPKGLVRDGSRLNLLILVRVGSDGLSDETAPTRPTASSPIPACAPIRAVR